MSVASLIRQYSRMYGVDPRAALAVARTEGGLRWGAVGDQGSSHGPFQLRRGGALPAGRNAAWANSPAGIQYAIQRMAASGARGKTGNAAIEAIVRNFERPADPGSEIAKAMGYYGGAAPSGAAGTPTASPGAPSGAQSAGLLSSLISASNRGTSANVLPLLAKLGQASAAPGPSPVSPSPQAGGGPSPSISRWLNVSAGADRAGVHTNQGVLGMAARVAQVYGSRLTIGTGTNHNQYVAGSNRQSAHWTGQAVDIPSSGGALTKLGQAALIAAGMPVAQARKQRGGLFNVGGWQIIFNSNVGGNHYNHLHMGRH